MTKTHEQIAAEAKELADALVGEPTMVGRTMRMLALLIHDLANAQTATSKTKPMRRRK